MDQSFRLDRCAHKGQKSTMLTMALDKITELLPGEDEIARTAIIKTAAGELKRTMKLLCPLPIE